MVFHIALIRVYMLCRKMRWLCLQQ